MLAFGFILITALSIWLFYQALGRSSRFLLTALIWSLCLSFLAIQGFFLETDTIPPRIMLAVLPTLAYVMYTLVKHDLAKINPLYLLGIHSIRIPVELTLYGLFLASLIPEIMTFSGWNLDILVGISAVLILVYQWRTGKHLSRNVLIVWNVLGLGFLLTIVGIAILSAPLPFQQLAFEQPNVAVLRFPYVLLPGVVVPLVLLSHLLSLKYVLRLRGKSSDVMQGEASAH